MRGSELVTLELVEELVDRGFHVDVYTNLFMDPVASLFDDVRRRGSVRVAASPYEDFGLDYDLIWVQHSLLPGSIIRRLVGNERAMPIVFHHMSSFVEEEAPLLADVQNVLAAVTLANSEDSAAWVRGFGIDEVAVHANPAPRGFAALPDPDADGPLRSLLVVSNHPPVEVVEAVDVLRDRGIAVDMVGEGGVVERVTPELIAAHDAVLTIGKTVQYALSAGRPAFVYDHFGGDGWVPSDMLEQSAAQNFSGRATRQRWTADELAARVVDGYRDAADAAASDRAALAARFGLPAALDRVLVSPRVAAPTPPSLTEAQAARWIAITELVRGLFLHSEHLQDRLAEATEPLEIVEPTTDEQVETIDDGSVAVLLLPTPGLHDATRAATSVAQQTIAADVVCIDLAEASDEPLPARIDAALRATATPFVAVHDGTAAWHPSYLERARTALLDEPRWAGVVVRHLRAIEDDVHGEWVSHRWHDVDLGFGGQLDVERMLDEEVTPVTALVARRDALLDAAWPEDATIAGWDRGLLLAGRGGVGVVRAEHDLVTTFHRSAADDPDDDWLRSHADRRQRMLRSCLREGASASAAQAFLLRHVEHQAHGPSHASTQRLVETRVEELAGRQDAVAREIARLAELQLGLHLAGGMERRIVRYVTRIPRRVLRAMRPKGADE